MPQPDPITAPGRKAAFVAAHIALSPAVLWNCAGVLATLANGALAGCAINAVMAVFSAGLAAYEAISGNRRNMPFGILIVVALGTLASLIHHNSGAFTLAALASPSAENAGIASYGLALVSWTVAHSCILLKTNVTRLKNAPLLNQMAFYNLGNFFAVQGNFASAVCFVLGFLKSLGWPATKYGTTVYAATKHLTAERLSCYGYLLGAGAYGAHGQWLMAMTSVLWGLGYIGFERDRIMDFIGLHAPSRKR